MFGNFFKKEPVITQHPNYPMMPLGIRINGLAKFKTSFFTYFLLNDGKMVVTAPSEADCVVNAISQFNLFNLTTYRAYLTTKPESIIQIHCDGKEILDTIFFQKVDEQILENNYAGEKAWKDVAGYKSINFREKYEYSRCWSADVELYGETVNMVSFTESYFNSIDNITRINNAAMMYQRILDGGTDEDIEYLWTAFRSGIGRYRIEVWAGTVVSEGQLEFF